MASQVSENGRSTNENDTFREKTIGLSQVLPRVLIVSRRTLRKNKFVDFVGEYHLDLIVKYGAVPVIVPRVSGLQSLLDSFEPIHGVLLCEGEDIDPNLYENDASLSPEELEEIREAHLSDCTIDHTKDTIELLLAKRCLERSIPFMGICRGSQVLNVACGGSLYTDVEIELSKKNNVNIKHIDYADYDGHRHPIKVVEDTPLYSWFKPSLSEGNKLLVNSYHHQGVKRLAARFQPMAFAPDGLIEAFYDPNCFNPTDGRFIMGLQFHPERMRHFQDGNFDSQTESKEIFDYPECPLVYQDFATAVVAFQKRTLVPSQPSTTPSTSTGLLDRGMKQYQKDIVRSFGVARRVYEEVEQVRKNPSVHGSEAADVALKLARSNSQSELNPGANFLQEVTPLGISQVRRLKAVGATVRNSTLALKSLQSQVEVGENHEVEDFKHKSREEIQEALEYHSKMAVALKELLLKNK